MTIQKARLNVLGVGQGEFTRNWIAIAADINLSSPFASFPRPNFYSQLGWWRAKERNQMIIDGIRNTAYDAKRKGGSTHLSRCRVNSYGCVEISFGSAKFHSEGVALSDFACIWSQIMESHNSLLVMRFQSSYSVNMPQHRSLYYYQFSLGSNQPITRNPRNPSKIWMKLL